MEVLTVKEVSSMLKIGKNKAYQLMNSKAFPSFKIGNKLLITDEALYEWLQKSKGKQISL